MIGYYLAIYSSCIAQLADAARETDANYPFFFSTSSAAKQSKHFG